VRRTFDAECSRCHRIFKFCKDSKDDGLCGKCRGKIKYINNIDNYRKTKSCPDCGKLIINASSRCNSCNQLRNKKPLNTCIDCGKIIPRRSISNRCRKCYIKSIPRGKNSPHYVDGRSMTNLRNDPKYLIWRSAVMKNDKSTCQLCGFVSKHNYGLQAHHIFPKRMFQELMFEVDNGITLCKKCHLKTYGKEVEFIEIFFRIKNRPVRNSVNSVKGETPNTEPSNTLCIEGVTTRDEIKFSMSAGQP
jgi:hypothetical protein